MVLRGQREKRARARSDETSRGVKGGKEEKQKQGGVVEGQDE